MWETERFIVANGFTQFNDQNVGNDLSPYDFFDGEVGFADVEFSDARGRRRKKRRRKGESGVEKVLSYTPIGMAKKGVDSLTSKEAVSRREKRRADRMALKNKEIDTQKQIVDASLKAGEKENQLLSQLGLSNNDSLPPISSEKPKSNKVIFIVGGVVIAGILGYVLYKKFKK
jgi:hypothetical protein